ncbi:MAG: EVE domain-containing protein [Proteobacteria bacterium]|nr:EVE domain-containing protein [Pseudomonadota bacterium]MBU4287069.1 EVE domain-containing protein [Pseudomonadota bacterium]MBU4413973.1 EVE domain-containing protein [Pseudomonadota bacterium]MCG2758792.1 EVE domain-containing protein [Desulfobacteraceae bacterium]
MNLLLFATIIVVLLIVLGVFKSDKRKTSIEDQKFWLFYAGPENYLDENGVRSLQGEVFWSCEPETRKGDLILLYRKSINQLSVNTLTRRFKMTKEVAQDIKKREVGKDISALWQAVSNSKRRFFWGWPYGCYVKEIQKLNPPIKLDELKASPELRRWESLRWNFQAKGHSALEIPPFVWESLAKIIKMKCGVRINQKSINT